VYNKYSNILAVEVKMPTPITQIRAELELFSAYLMKKSVLEEIFS